MIRIGRWPVFDGRQGTVLRGGQNRAERRCIDKNVTITGQSTQKADQNSSIRHLIYPLFTSKSEG
jgi:hypothetical protein